MTEEPTPDVAVAVDDNSGADTSFATDDAGGAGVDTSFATDDGGDASFA
jgi:hypothetical protein